MEPSYLGRQSGQSGGVAWMEVGGVLSESQEAEPSLRGDKREGSLGVCVTWLVCPATQDTLDCC